MRSSRTALALIALAMLAAACGSGGDSDTATTPTASEDDEASTTTVPVDSTQPDSTNDAAAGGDTRSELLREITAVWETDWSMTTIDLSELAAGIQRRDPRDLIRPIDEPRFQPIAEAEEWIDPRVPGAVVTIGEETRFYPVSIMTRHEIVNDWFGDVPVAVTYCPLCNTAITFDRRVDDEVLRLGVSGLLRNSDLVMWDDSTTSLWQQITGEGIVGAHAGRQLTIVPTALISFGELLESWPEATVLAQDQGFGTGYGVNPYVGYSSRPAPYEGFAEAPTDDRYPALERVVGITLEGGDHAVPFSVLADEPAVHLDVGGTPVVVLWGGDTADALDQSSIKRSAAIGTAVAFDARIDGETLNFVPTGDGRFTDAETGSTWTVTGRAVGGELTGAQLEIVPHRNEFWFAWTAFFPDAPVYEGAI